MKEIIPTIVPDSFADLSAKSALLGSFARTLHIDIGDGVFSPKKTWTPEGQQIFPESDHVFFEAHLMVRDPLEIGLRCIIAGAKRIIAHLEAFPDAGAVTAACDAWKAAGAEVGLALLLESPIESLQPHLTEVSVVHFMTIASIGVQGIPFDVRSIARIAAFHAQHPDMCISVDGGQDESCIQDVARAGVRHFAVGSAIATASDPATVYRRLSALVNTV